MLNDDADFEITETSLSGDMPHRDIFARASSRRRAVQFGALVVVLILGAIGLRGSIRTFSAPSQHLAMAPTRPTITQHVGIQTDVSYGALTFNGKPTAFIPGGRDFAHTLPLRPGRNTLILHAPPFTAITCVIDAIDLQQTADQPRRCGLTFIDGFLWSINMAFLPGDLPPGARQDFDAYAQRRLAQLQAISAIVAPGDHYAGGRNADGSPLVLVAPAPLTAHILAESIDATPPAPQCNGAFCSFTSIALPQTPSPAPPFVMLSYEVALGWQVDSATGQTQSAYIPAFPTCQSRGGCYDPATDVMLAMTYSDAAGWQDFYDPEFTPGLNTRQERAALIDATCQNATQFIVNRYQSQRPNTQLLVGTAYSTLTGCLFIANADPNATDPGPLNENPVTDAAHPWFLMHFGAMLAVDDLAQTLIPQLPRATASEVNEVFNNTPGGE